MADPEIPHRTKSKRKRWTTLPDPEEVTAEILDQLQSSRLDIDRTLAKFNDTFMQTQNGKRRRFIKYCETRICDLPNSVRSTVAAQLLSSEDFAVEMNFPELHTSTEGKSSLTWSCADASLSDASWRTLLEAYAESAAHTTRATIKGPFPAPPSTPMAEPSGHPTSMSLVEVGMTNEDAFIEDEDDEEDILSTPEVTIPKSTTARTLENLAAHQRNESSSTRKQQAPVSKEKSLKKSSSRPYRWSKEESDTLRKLCGGKADALQWNSPIWKEVSAYFPGRTQNACWLRWARMRGVRTYCEKRSTGGSGTPTAGVVKGGRWSPDELKQLAKCAPKPGKACDWAKVARKIPGRTAHACYLQHRKISEAADREASTGAHSQGAPTSGAEEVNGESE